MSTQLQSQTSSIPKGLIRSTGIGGLLGAGIAALLYFCFPGYVAFVDRHWFYIVCTATGTVLYQALKHTWRLLKAFLERDTIDKKLQRLDRLHEDKRISDDTYQQIVKDLCKKEFLE